VSFLSIVFAAFLAAGLLVYHNAPVPRRPAILLVLSFLFYATWSVWDAALLLAVTAGVYGAARLLDQTPSESRKLRLLTVAIAGLLVLLVGFKCAWLLATQLNAAWVEGNPNAVLLLAAPLGLSYYSFKLLGYLLDVYWGTLPARRDFVPVALYAAFFPQIVSGPIQRAQDFFTQLDAQRASDPDSFVLGLRRILFGLFKKVAIADQLAVVVTHAHGHSLQHSSLELLLGAYCFSLQMYADFSGITDIAIGTGLLFGIRGPENFNRPYFAAANLQEFWRRWHMSLTSWLTDYLFVPLRMTFRHLGNAGLALAIFINMVAVGIWHGPRWTYLVFGCLNGVFMIVSVLTLKRRNQFFKTRPTLTRWRAWVAPLVTFHLVVLTHIFFQAPDLHSALSYLGQMLHLAPHGTVAASRMDLSSFGLTYGRLFQALAGLVVMETIHWAMSQPDWAQRFNTTRREFRWVLYYAVIVMVMLSARGTTSFIYAKF